MITEIKDRLINFLGFYYCHAFIWLCLIQNVDMSFHFQQTYLTQAVIERNIVWAYVRLGKSLPIRTRLLIETFMQRTVSGSATMNKWARSCCNTKITKYVKLHFLMMQPLTLGIRLYPFASMPNFFPILFFLYWFWLGFIHQCLSKPCSRCILPVKNAPHE